MFVDTTSFSLCSIISDMFTDPSFVRIIQLPASFPCSFTHLIQDKILNFPFGVRGRG